MLFDVILNLLTNLWPYPSVNRKQNLFLLAPTPESADMELSQDTSLAM